MIRKKSEPSREIGSMTFQLRLEALTAPEQWVTHVMSRSLAWGILDLSYPRHKTEVFHFLFIPYNVWNTTDITDDHREHSEIIHGN